MRIGFIGAENAPILNNDNHETFLFRLTFLVYAVCCAIHAAKGSFHESSSIPAFPKIRTSELGYFICEVRRLFFLKSGGGEDVLAPDPKEIHEK
ncbi:MAG: hypothetical protein O2964_08070 [Verrucomicrobia bacterium]|nr:hypothetical protein [Verrucomicrobiota bacterium]